jgi:hypothetical protein
MTSFSTSCPTCERICVIQHPYTISDEKTTIECCPFCGSHQIQVEATGSGFEDIAPIYHRRIR